jgi:predicted extracellular nuclease
MQPTNVVAPGPSSVALQDLNDRSRIILDDVASVQNPNPIPYKDGSNTRRVGDVVPALSGILDERFGAYRVQPVGTVTFASGNPRPAVPAVGGSLRVMSANVLNLFKTIDNGSSTVTCTSGLAPRGCNNANECSRQLQKLVTELLAIKPDIAGLTEIENDADSGATRMLVDALNAASGSPGDYAFIQTGCIGTDAIRVAMIYRTSKVRPEQGFKVLDHTFSADFIDTKNRPALAQTFSQVAGGGKLTLVLNHLKSKGSDCLDVADPDLGQGQGNCNLTRTKAAQVLLDWIATDPTGSHDPDFVIMGDLNAYAMEDPIAKLTAGGYSSVIEAFTGSGGYSYQFAGQSGALDHALASRSLLGQVTGAAEFHSNADEPVVLDYNTEFKTDDPFNGSDAFRASDHDAIVFGLELNTAAPVPALPTPGWVLVLFGLIGIVVARPGRTAAADSED